MAKNEENDITGVPQQSSVFLREENLAQQVKEAIEKVALDDNPDAQRDFLQKIVSNLKLFNGTLIVSYTSDFRFMAENHHLEMGSLSYEPRGDLSQLLATNYIVLTLLWQGLSTLERRITGQVTDKKVENMSVLSGHFWPKIT